MTVLQNTIILQNGVPARIHIVDHHIERRTITDPTTGGPVVRQTLILDVDRLDGQSVQAILSTMAEKFAGQFEPYLADKSYRGYEIIVTQYGDGFQRRWSVTWIPTATTPK